MTVELEQYTEGNVTICQVCSETFPAHREFCYTDEAVRQRGKAIDEIINSVNVPTIEYDVKFCQTCEEPEDNHASWCPMREPMPTEER